MCVYVDSPAGAEPSIGTRVLYIPLNTFFNLKPQMAFPLVALQYNELTISILIRPIYELFKIRDVMDYNNNFPYIAPNFNFYYQQMHRFLQTPPDVELGVNSYTDVRNIWNPDINLNCTYCFLSNEETNLFAKNEQKYLIKQVYEHKYYNVTGSNKVRLDSLGMVSSWMFFFRRSDANLRNEWTNYTNWPYNYKPSPVEPAPSTGIYPNPNPNTALTPFLGPGQNPSGNLSGLLISGVYNPQNIKEILIALGIQFDGDYRENVLPVQVYNFVEKYVRTGGDAPSGLYCYNFCLDTDPFYLQPSGAMNMNRFTNIEFEFTTIIPPLDPYAQVLTICDENSGEVIGINKPTWRIYDYNFDLHVFEERINMVTFIGGNAALTYAT